jgi:hypothetical protein
MHTSSGVTYLPVFKISQEKKIYFTIPKRIKNSVQESEEAEYKDDISVSLESGLNSSTISLLQIS